MLSQCRAYVVAAGEAQDRALFNLAQRVEFGEVRSVRQGEPLPRDLRVTFFLVDYQLSDPAMLQVIANIRSNGADTIRLAPIVVFFRDGPHQIVLKLIDFGFDDVIALPDKREVLASRLGAQLNDDITYFETPTYLGPDRRRMELPTELPDPRRKGSSDHTRLLLRRDPITGIKVLRREIFGLPRRRPFEPTTAVQHGAAW